MYKSKYQLDENTESKIKLIIDLTNELGGIPPWYLTLRSGKIHATIEIEDGINADVDQDLNLLGVEYYGC